MGYRIQENCQGIDWDAVYGILTSARMASHPLEKVRSAFENSYRTVFVFEGDLLLGFGRAISDGAYEAALYDVAVLPEYRGKGIGKLIVTKIQEGLPGMNTIFFAMPGVEKFYRSMGYAKMLTGMAKFARAEVMREKGFSD
ncbi:GNAT family N-acetyltransferase [Anaeroselena agilis]|uniref:GNAT family N-acetyltransferase n=1 Tax=Anaeroselena agilis TaxID=3063788 RepID=A0ABU3P0D6_9FIRM|nr:GNAT family N-acetyltransferase [Selenomonadales bacterium 4137-cl]